jgi:putative phosphoribosyl transferase
MAYEIAQALHLPWDICLVRKLGLPGHKELAMGAIAANGVRVLNYDVVAWHSISSKQIEEVAAKELRELQRRDHVYRGTREAPQLRDRVVIVVDDGLATGASMRAAIQVIQQQEPARVVVAVPVAPKSACEDLSREVDEMVCLMQPEPFYAIAQWYDNFAQVSDGEVCALLGQSSSSTTHLTSGNRGSPGRRSPVARSKAQSYQLT